MAAAVQGAIIRKLNSFTHIQKLMTHFPGANLGSNLAQGQFDMRMGDTGVQTNLPDLLSSLYKQSLPMNTKF